MLGSPAAVLDCSTDICHRNTSPSVGACSRSELDCLGTGRAQHPRRLLFRQTEPSEPPRVPRTSRLSPLYRRCQHVVHLQSSSGRFSNRLRLPRMVGIRCGLPSQSTSRFPVPRKVVDCSYLLAGSHEWRDPGGGKLDAASFLLESLERLLTGRFLQFRDFWLGDQLCSLYYSLSNTYRKPSKPLVTSPQLVNPASSGNSLALRVSARFCADYQGCLLDQQNLGHTNTGLSSVSLPRRSLCSSVLFGPRREVGDANIFPTYLDCSNRRTHRTHLVNIGKYCLSIVYLFSYYNWRIKGE